LADLPQDPGSIDWDAVQSVIIHHSTGVDVLPAPPSPQTAELVTAAAVSAILPLARARYKWVIVDTSSTFSELNLGVFDQSDLLLLPVAPDMTSVKVMQSTLDVFAALQTPAERRVLILNQTHPKAHIGQPELEQHLGERIGLTLPYAEEAILDSIDQGVPLAATNPAHPTVAALQAFAARLAQVKVEAVEQQKRGGFCSWVQGLIGSLRK
jgi:pilus assembly protein CpaE